MSQYQTDSNTIMMDPTRTKSNDVDDDSYNKYVERERETFNRSYMEYYYLFLPIQKTFNRSY